MARSPLDIIKNIRKNTAGIVNRGKDFFRDENAGGVAKNTVLGLPTASKKVANVIGRFGKETFFSNRGFSEIDSQPSISERIDNALKGNPALPKEIRSTTKDKIKAVSRIPSEIISGLGDLSLLIPGQQERAEKVLRNPIGQKIADVGQKIQEYGKPKNAGEAQAMRIADIATNFLPIGKAKNVSKIPVKSIVSGLEEGLIKNINRAAPEYESILKAVKEGVDLPPVPVYKLKDGTYALNKDGAKRFLAHQEAGVKDIKVKIEPKTGMTASAKQAFERKLYEKPPTLEPETKDNIVKIIDDHRLNKGKDLTLQEDAARIAEDLNLPKSKTYGELVNQLEEVLVKQPDDVREVLQKKPGLFETAKQNLKDPRKRQGGFIKNPLADDLDPTSKAFNNSKEQRRIGDSNFVIGSFGDNAITRKTKLGQPDRIPVSELEDTIKNIKNDYRAGDSSFRKDNIVHIAEMPNGEKRAVITRINSSGQEEVINLFKLGKNPEVFIKNLEKFGTPTRTRTGIGSLERSSSNPLKYGDTKSLSDLPYIVKETGDNFKKSNPKSRGVSSQSLEVGGQSQSPKGKSPVKSELPQVTGSKIFSLQNDTKKLANSQVNLSRFDVSEESKVILKNAIEDVKPKIEAKVGSVLSNNEALDYAERSSRVINQAAGRESTLEWEAALLRSRQKLAQAAETGTVDREFIDTLLAIKSQATDIGRKLQSFSIRAEPKDITSKQAIIEAVLGLTENVDEILKAAQGVDFTNLKAATEFYRKFVKPTAGEWVDLLRYNSMLSSPKTHIVNVFSNAINSTIIPVIEKAVAGGLDFLGSALTGRDRQMFAGEAGAYLKGYIKNLKDATERFSGVMAGTRRYSNLDIKNLPIAVSGAKGKVVSALSYPMRLLEGADQFFTALTESGEAASLALRKGRGANVGNIPALAEDKAAYRLYRRDLFSEEQGPVLDALDQMTRMVQTLRNNKNPIVSNIAKFTVPFLQTPMNIFKQGIEYSPAGFSTVIGAANKTEQLAKAVIGSAVFTSAATMLMSNRLSWSEPINPDEKAAFRDAGKQPYSMKIGNKWVAYQKLPPPVAFPFAMAALIDDSLKNKKISQDTGDLILSTIAKYGSFLSDQSYAKSIGDLMTAVQGGEDSIAKLVSNYPQQLVPFRALGGWISRLTDGIQRKPDQEAEFIDKQVQLLMMNIPGLSKKVPARTNDLGEEIKQQLPVLNAFSPVNITQENPGKAETYEAIRKNKIEESNYKFQSKSLIQKVIPTYNEIQKLKLEGKEQEAIDLFNSLSDQEKQAYKSHKASESSAETNQGKKNILPTFQSIRALKEQGKNDEAIKAYNALSDEQKKYYQIVKKQKDREAKAIEGVKPKFDEGEETDSKGIIDTALLYAKAIGVDPVTAFNRIFTGQKIRYLANDSIVVERLGLDDSEAIKEARGGNDASVKLDHTVPLQLGGSNSESNLKLVPTDVWKTYTPIENAIGKALREKKVNKKRAQKLIEDFKAGILTAAEVYEELK